MGARLDIVRKAVGEIDDGIGKSQGRTVFNPGITDLTLVWLDLYPYFQKFCIHLKKSKRLFCCIFNWMQRSEY